MDISGKIPEGEMLESGNQRSSCIPLAVYVGEERRIVGEAKIVNGFVEAHIHSGTTGASELVELIETGVIITASLTFNAPAAIPIFQDGHVKWIRNY